MDIQNKIQEIVDRIKGDDTLLESFKREPIETIERTVGVDLPNEKIDMVVASVKAKLGLGVNPTNDPVTHAEHVAKTGLYEKPDHPVPPPPHEDPNHPAPPPPHEDPNHPAPPPPHGHPDHHVHPEHEEDLGDKLREGFNDVKHNVKDVMDDGERNDSVVNHPDHLNDNVDKAHLDGREYHHEHPEHEEDLGDKLRDGFNDVKHNVKDVMDDGERNDSVVNHPDHLNENVDKAHLDGREYHVDHPEHERDLGDKLRDGFNDVKHNVKDVMDDGKRNDSVVKDYGSMKDNVGEAYEEGRDHDRDEILPEVTDTGVDTDLPGGPVVVGAIPPSGTGSGVYAAPGSVLGGGVVDPTPVGDHPETYVEGDPMTEEEYIKRTREPEVHEEKEGFVDKVKDFFGLDDDK